MNILHEVALTSGATVNIECPLVGSGLTILDTQNYLYMAWGIYTSHTLDFKVIGSNAYNLANPVNLIVQSVLATAFTTPYELSSPYNATGLFVINAPFVRLAITETATANHTATRVFVRRW